MLHYELYASMSNEYSNQHKEKFMYGWFLAYLTTLFQLQTLYIFESDKTITDLQYVKFRKRTPSPVSR